MQGEFERLAQMMDLFAGARTADERWAVAEAIAAQAGLNAHNVGAARIETGELTYMRSAMSEEWLTEYVEEAYFTTDRFVEMIRDDPHQRFYTWQDETPRSDKEKSLWGRINDEGYRTGFGQSFDSDRPGERRVVTLFSEDTKKGDWHPERKAEMRAISLVFNAHLFGSDHRAGGLIAPEPLLSGRERDVLLLLASGLQNQQIADRLGLAEVTVRMHFASARKKLGGRTREHAMAIALRDDLIAF